MVTSFSEAGIESTDGKLLKNKRVVNVPPVPLAPASSDSENVLLIIMTSILSPLKPITRNLPPFIRHSGQALLGNECYTTLIYNLDLSDKHCLRYSLSKVLGLGIVVGGGIVKVPQILKILKSRSVRGLSLTSYLLDTASLLVIVAYNMRLAFPFSTYGENIALVLQNIVIVYLILYYSSQKTSLANAPSSPWSAIVGFSIVTLLLSIVLLHPTLTPVSLLRTLVAISIPVSLSAKIPQIYKNYQLQSTGQLSAFLVFNSLAGCLARVFTTATETNDATLWWSFASAALLNGIIAVQMLYYWNVKTPIEPIKIHTDEKVSITVPMISPSPKLGTGQFQGGQLGSNSPVGGKPISGTRWQRKAE